MAKYDMVCDVCGSANVVADAYASWNYHTQQWEVSGVYDKGGYCNDCDRESRLDAIEIKDEIIGITEK